MKYCTRFYDRQFITRENANQGIIEQFETLINEYIFGEKLKNEGLPSVAYFAEKLHLSPNYFGDLIKKETGQSAKDYILNKTLNIAKDKLFEENKTVNEIVYELGFKYPQHLTRLFKQKAGVSPMEFRGLN